MRLGGLRREALELAAYAGDPGARSALGEDAPEAESDLSAWVLGLRRWGREALVRAALAASETALALFEAEYPERPTPRRAHEATVAWLEDPSPARAGVARELAHATFDLSVRLQSRMSSGVLGRPGDAFRRTAAEAALAIAYGAFVTCCDGPRPGAPHEPHSPEKAAEITLKLSRLAAGERALPLLVRAALIDHALQRTPPAADGLALSPARG
jgi:hypothetical protein